MTLTIASFESAPELLDDWARRIFEEQKEKGDKELEKKVDELFILSRLFQFSPMESLDVTFPLTVELSEKPDFVLRCGGRVVGVEVTKFQAEQRARAESIINDRHESSRKDSSGPPPMRPLAIYSMTPFDFDSKKRKNTEIAGRMVPRQTGLADWVSIEDRVEVHAKRLTEIIGTKSEKVKGHSLGAHAELWLLIEDRMNLSRFSLSHILPRVGRSIHENAKEIPFSMILISLIPERDVVGFARNV